MGLYTTGYCRRGVVSGIIVRYNWAEGRGERIVGSGGEFKIQVGIFPAVGDTFFSSKMF
jgi:hypothetical protein